MLCLLSRWVRGKTCCTWVVALLLVDVIFVDPPVAINVVAAQQQQDELEEEAGNRSNDGDGDGRFLLWSSTGGGWRAMFADIGYANLFRRASLFDESSTKFDSVATVSGASWFSAQLFYSGAFYNRTVLADGPEELEAFVLEWMGSYSGMSAVTASAESRAVCESFARLDDEEGDEYEASSSSSSSSTDGDTETVKETIQEICELLFAYNHDWAFFVQAMMNRTSNDYGDPGFADTIANPQNRIEPMKKTDLLIQASLMPNSRIRNENEHNGDATATNGGDSGGDTAVYIGYEMSGAGSGNGDDGNGRPTLFTVPLSAAWVVDEDGAAFWYGTNDLVPSSGNTTNNNKNNNGLLQTYTSPTPAEHSWEAWEAYQLYPGEEGTITIDSARRVDPSKNNGGALQTPFGGEGRTTVAQVAAISSAAAGSGSPLIPSIFTQMFSIGRHNLTEAGTPWWWRLSSGVAAGMVAAAFFGWLVYRWWLGATTPSSEACEDGAGGEVDDGAGGEVDDEADSRDGKENVEEESTDSNDGCGITDISRAAVVSGISGTCCCLVVGSVVGVVVGFGSALLPVLYDKGVDQIYQESTFDKLSVCSQWPNECGARDAHFIDGYYIDNPAVVINVGHHLQKHGVNNTKNQTMKLIVTNTNQVWDTEFNIAQILQYFSTDLNKGVSPGDYLWCPGLYAPYRSPQIFEEFLDEDGLNTALKPVPGSNMTTANFRATTIENPAFGVLAGQVVDILLLNLNEEITTYVVGKSIVDQWTQPLADMTKNIAFNEVLLERVLGFVEAGSDENE